MSPGYLWAEFIDIFVFSRSVWFLVVLFLVEAMVIIAYSFVGKNRFKYVVFIALWIVICILPVQELFAFYRLKCFFPFFILGMLCREYKICDRINLKVWFVGILFIIGGRSLIKEEYLSAYLNFAYADLSDMRGGFYCYFFSILAICLALTVGMYMKRKRIGRLMAAVGQYSMEIYVMHMLLVKFILFAPDAVMEKDIYIYSYFALYAVFITVLIVLSVRYILEHWKMFRIVTGRK